MADRLLDGALIEFMTAAYDESHSWEEVSRRLLTQHNVVVTGQTLRKWAHELGIGVAA